MAGGSGIVIVRYTTAAVGNTSDATTDNLTDSPTQYGHDSGLGGEVVGNYATWNPLDKSPTAVLSGGNLDVTPGFTTQTLTRATMAVPLGQWYFEVTCRSIGGDASAGEIGFNTTAARAIDGGYTTWAVNSIYYVSTTGNKSIFGTNTAYGATWTANDIIGVAIDTVAGTIVFYKNGASQGTITNALITPNTLFPVFANNSTSGSRNMSANFGQRPWAYAPPAGYNALTTKNFARLTAGTPAANPNQYFDAVTYTGTAATQTITLPGAFQPDLVWFKNRGTSQNHHLMDVNRGGGTILYANLTNTEDALGTSWANFTSTGFSLGASAGVNTSANTYVAWCWRAGGAPVSNTAGTITSQVSANTASGFSIVTYTGTGATATVGHGLGVTPSMIIVKSRSNAYNWAVYHSSLTSAAYALQLNNTIAQTNSYNYWNSTVPTSSVFSLGTDAGSNLSTGTYVAYCWTEIAGFSKFGTYTGNGSATDGPFIYTGFKPAFYMAKCTSATSNAWIMYDNKRSTYNLNGQKLGANVADEENNAAQLGDSTTGVDFLSNGIKIRSPGSNNNTSAATYIFMAFAEKPFGNVNGTAR
jgi:hypothetical protein